MSKLPDEIAQLTDGAAIRALETATTKYLELSGVAVPQVAAITKTLFEIEAAEDVEALEKSDVGQKGALAKQALAEMAASSDRRAARVVDIAVRDAVTTGQVEPVTTIVIGGYLLALAVVSKVTYDPKKGVGLKPGFPGLANVLSKAGKLISAAVGAGDEGAPKSGD